jgi:uncharacterized damage-inducible protein DinB
MIMLRRVEDFQQAWAQETAGTLKLLHQLTEASLAQAVTPGGRTLGRLAWHIVLSLPEMGRHAGLTVAGPDEKAPVPSAAGMAATYEQAACDVAAAVRAQWTDAQLGDEIPMYGESWPKGVVLSALMAHQAHHRGQMTVLMRQAGLPVAGVYGPSREEWATMGMPPQE